MKMSSYSHADKTHFHMKSFARRLALKNRHKTIRKWPISSVAPYGGVIICYEVTCSKYLLYVSSNQILVSFVELVMYHGEVKHQSRGADTHSRSAG